MKDKKKEKDNEKEINPSVRKKKEKSLKELESDELRDKVISAERERSFWERRAYRMEEMRNKWRLLALLFFISFWIIIAVKVLLS